MRVAQVEARFAGLDALLNIAGGFASRTLESGSTDDWTAMHRINLVTAASASRSALPLLRKSGAMLLQAITIQDQHYRAQLRTVNFIQRYVFPGSFLPSVSVPLSSLFAETLPTRMRE